MNLVRIAEAVPLDGFRLRLTLTNGEVVDRDVGHLLTGPVFDTLRAEPGRFRTVKVVAGALVWPGGADLCPDMVIWGGMPPAVSTAEAPPNTKGSGRAA